MKHNAVTCRECDREVPDNVEICETCTDEFRDDLTSIPGLVVDIHLTAARLDKVNNTGNTSKSAETPLPIRISGKTIDDPERNTYTHPYIKLPTDDQIPTQRPYTQLEHTITEWALKLEHHYRTAIPLHAKGLQQLVKNNRDTTTLDPANISHTPIRDIEPMAIWIACNPQLIRAYPAAHEMITEIRNTIIRARMAVDRLPELQTIGPCKNCGSRLRAEKGSTWVRCPGCREQYEVTKLLETTLKAADDMVFSPNEIHMLLRQIDEPVKTGTFNSWVSRRKLPAKAWRRPDGRITSYRLNDTDEPLYRLGDVRELRRIGIRHGDTPQQSTGN